MNVELQKFLSYSRIKLMKHFEQCFLDCLNANEDFEFILMNLDRADFIHGWGLKNFWVQKTID